MIQYPSDIIEVGGLESVLYCFTFVWCVIPMWIIDGSNTLAKDCCGLYVKWCFQSMWANIEPIYTVKWDFRCSKELIDRYLERLKITFLL